MRFEGERKYRIFAICLLVALSLLFLIVYAELEGIFLLIFGIVILISVILASLSIIKKSELIIENETLKYYVPLKSKKIIKLSEIIKLTIQPNITVEIGKNRLSSVVDQVLNIESKDDKSFYIILADFRKDLDELFKLVEKDSGKEIKNKFLVDAYLRETTHLGMKNKIQK